MNAGEAGFRASSFVRGGTGALSAALARAATANRAEIRTGTAVEKIMLEDGKASGVGWRTADVPGHAILSSATPRHTFFDLTGASNLEVSFGRELRNIRYRGCTARLNLALDGLPAFRSLPAGDDGGNPLSGHILLCPSLDYLEHAYDDAKYGAISQQPVLDAVIPTLLDDSLAPPGKHILSVNIQYAPYHLQSSSWEAQGAELVELVLGVLEEHAPGIRGQVLHEQILTPLDLEREYGLSEGCIFHGQMALDQLWFMRPVPGPAPYETPIPKLFLCGAGSHPGGGVPAGTRRGRRRRRRAEGDRRALKALKAGLVTTEVRLTFQRAVHSPRKLPSQSFWQQASDGVHGRFAGMAIHFLFSSDPAGFPVKAELKLRHSSYQPRLAQQVKRVAKLREAGAGSDRLPQVSDQACPRAYPCLGASAAAGQVPSAPLRRLAHRPWRALLLRIDSRHRPHRSEAYIFDSIVNNLRTSLLHHIILKTAFVPSGADHRPVILRWNHGA